VTAPAVQALFGTPDQSVMAPIDGATTELNYGTSHGIAFEFDDPAVPQSNITPSGETNVNLILVTSSAYSTPAGVKIGSPSAAVVSAYPAVKCAAGTCELDTPDGSSVIIQTLFQIDAGTNLVDQISIDRYQISSNTYGSQAD
jgi:hypothetical protein